MADQKSIRPTNTRLYAVRCKVLKVVERESEEIDSKTRLPILGSKRTWREILIQCDDGREHWITGEIVYGADVGDDIALVFDPRGREPLFLANISRGTHVEHGSIDQEAKASDSVFGLAVLFSCLGVIPAFIVLLFLFSAVVPGWAEQNAFELLKAAPLVSIPAAIYLAIRLDRKALARAKLVYGEVLEVLDRAGVTIQDSPSTLPSSRHMNPA